MASTAPRSLRRAVTMVEIMVVIVIIGILSALAVPRFNTYTGESQLDGDANLFYQDFVWARTESIKRGVKMRVVISNTTVDGSPRVKLTFNTVDASGTLTEIRSSVGGVSVALGLPTGVSAPTGTQIPVLANLGVFANGYQSVDAAAPEAAETNTCRNSSATTPKWDDGIQICGTSVGDAETGAVYFYSTRSGSRAYGLAFDRSKSLSFIHMRYMGGSWEKL